MKQGFLFFLTITFAGILTTGCGNNNNPQTADTVKDSASAFDITAMKKIIEEKNTAFANAFVSGDSAGMVNNYTQDGKLFPPNSPAVIGRPAIGALVSQYLKFGIKEFRDEITALYGNEDNLIEEGNYFMGDGKGNTIDKGKYIDIWRKVDGDWKVYSNMFNTSMPAAPAK
ncbi:MAG TPA: nuclear transport factor 2 family protein [Chitinophagaceae bacterium]